jgi:glutathione S-transferase
MILRGWALDDRTYAVRLGASLMGVPLLPETDRRAETEGPVLVAEGKPIDGARDGLRHIASLPSVPSFWRETADLAAVEDAARWLDDFSSLRRRAFAAPMPDDTIRPAAHRLIRALEDRLAEERDGWLSGASPGLADILAFPVAALSHDLRIEHDLYPALRHFIRRVRALPGFLTMPGIPECH